MRTNFGTDDPQEIRRFAPVPLATAQCRQNGLRLGFVQPLAEHGERIVKWFQAFEGVEDRAKIVTLDEIKDEGWTLNISRYVLPPIGEDIPPLPEAVAAFKDALTEARDAEDHLRTMLTKGGWLE